MSLSAAIFGEDSTVWKIGNILGLGIPKLLNNLIATQNQERAIGEIEKVTAGEGGHRTIVWGRVRPIGGNTIHAGEPISYWMEEENEGKGESDNQTTLVEHVFRTYAIGICEGPITKVTRVWRNNKLVYDDRGNAWGFLNNYIFLQRAKFYKGDWNQMPAPELEVFWGAGEVPAYRGTAYMTVFLEDLTDMGGSIPQYQFEVEKAEGYIYTSTQYAVDQFEAYSPEFEVKDLSTFVPEVGKYESDVTVTNITKRKLLKTYNEEPESFESDVVVTGITKVQTARYSQYDEVPESFESDIIVTGISKVKTAGYITYTEVPDNFESDVIITGITKVKP